jgi:hypothetical protein
MIVAWLTVCIIPPWEQQNKDKNVWTTLKRLVYCTMFHPALIYQLKVKLDGQREPLDSNSTDYHL